MTSADEHVRPACLLQRHHTFHHAQVHQRQAMLTSAMSPSLCRAATRDTTGSTRGRNSTYELPAKRLRMAAKAPPTEPRIATTSINVQNPFLHEMPPSEPWLVAGSFLPGLADVPAASATMRLRLATKPGLGARARVGACSSFEYVRAGIGHAAYGLAICLGLCSRPDRNPNWVLYKCMSRPVAIPYRHDAYGYALASSVNRIWLQGP